MTEVRMTAVLSSLLWWCGSAAGTVILPNRKNIIIIFNLRKNIIIFNLGQLSMERRINHHQRAVHQPYPVGHESVDGPPSRDGGPFSFAKIKYSPPQYMTSESSFGVFYMPTSAYGAGFNSNEIIVPFA